MHARRFAAVRQRSGLHDLQPEVAEALPQVGRVGEQALEQVGPLAADDSQGAECRADQGRDG